MKHLIKTILLLSFISVSGQVKFEKGYIVDNNGVKKDCFIKNEDSQYNPSKIVFKNSLEDKEEYLANVSDVKAFGIGDDIKFEKFYVKIDQEENDTYGISDTKDFNFINKTLFLKILVEGQAKLYLYQDKYSYRYFYSKDLPEVSQLIYKKYRPDDGKIVLNNDQYKKQLFEDFKCKDLTSNNFRKLRYFKNELIAIFNKYNTCTGEESVNYIEKKKGKFNYKVKGGVNFSSVDIDFSEKTFYTDARSAEFEKSNSLRAGVEVEYILPFNKNKWAAFIEPTYGSFEGESTIIVEIPFNNDFVDKVSIDYSYIEVPIGLRHYMYFNGNKESRLFLNIAYVFSVDLGDSKVDYGKSEDVEIDSRSNIIFGVGYNYNKYSLELRVSGNRNIASKNLTTKVTYSPAFAINFGYKIF